PDNKTLATSSLASIQLLDAVTGRRLRSFGTRALCLAFSSDGKLLASGEIGKDLSVWEVRTGRAVRSFNRLQSDIGAVAFSPDGKKLAAASATVQLWDVVTGQELCRFE